MAETELTGRGDEVRVKSRWRDSAKRGLVKVLGKAGRSRVPGELKVGPVIGKVTDTTARILIEVNKPGLVQITLTPVREPELARSLTRGLTRRISRRQEARPRRPREVGANQKAVSVEKRLAGGRAEVFQIGGLVPATKYTVEFEGVRGAIPTSFRTFPSEPEESGVTVGVISCNKIFVTEQEIPPHSDLWAHLEKSIRSGVVDQLVHLGDQVYGDGDKFMDEGIAEQQYDKWSDRFKLSMALLKDVPPKEWKNKEQAILEKYREVYRETWGHPPTACCLANCPNLMIYDDHEVRDNWGDSKEHGDASTVEFFIARCAWIVNLEYQRQLHEDVDFEKLDSIHKDYHLHVIGGVGYLFVDIRGSRSFHRQEGDPKPYLGSRQWEDLHKCLGPGGLFDSVRALLVCTPAPLVFLDPGFTCVLGRAVQRLEDFKGHWSAPAHINEQIEFCDALCSWKSSGKGRELLVLGGDVHCGGHSRVTKDNEVKFCQLTTSAIANRPLPKSAYYLLRAAGRAENLQKGYSFSHHRWTRSRNYGIVEISNIRPQDQGLARISSQLVIGKLLTGIKGGDVVCTTDEQQTGLCGRLCI